MYNDDPLNTLAHALSDHEQRCLALGLNTHQAQVVMFAQCWTQRPRGGQSQEPPQHLAQSDGQPSQAPTCTHWQVHTVVITDADADSALGASVYFGAQLAYRIASPNRRFFLDVAAQCMAPLDQCGRYEGRDDAEIESADFGLEMDICRLHAQLKCSEPGRCQCVARLLHTFAKRFEACEAAASAVVGERTSSPPMSDVTRNVASEAKAC